MDTKLITPEYVRNMKSISTNYLCSLEDNTYGIKFTKFRVRDMDSNTVLFEVEEEKSEEPEKQATSQEKEENRLIRYHLGPDFLELRNLGTQLTFAVGDKPVKNLLMIERHYFKKEILLKSFEFSFDFCIPNSTNEWETIYNIPPLDENLKDDMIDNPWETQSDSFYFVENKLIMHNKAIYNYSYSDS